MSNVDAAALVALRGTWNYPTHIRFGVGRVAELPDACRELGMSRPLLVTDRGLATLPIVAETLTLARTAGLGVGLFADVEGNPTGAHVRGGVEVFREGGHDGVIAFGGGSALDVAKAIGLMVGQDRPLWDYEDRADWWTRVRIEGMAPVVAVPTTAGTGSEVGRASVIVHTAEHRKVIIFHPRMLPERVICDPALTVGLPPRITAWTGIDALSHNLEAWCSPLFHPLAEGIATQGIRLIREGLVDAVEDGEDLVARSKMLAASLMGATAFQRGLGAMHAMAHPIGAHHHTHHGLTNAVLMPYVLVFNRAQIEGRIAQLATAIGLGAFTDQPAAGFDAFLDWVLDFRRSLGIPRSLGELGVDTEAAVALAQEAAEDPSAGTNPRPLTAENLAPLLDAAARGDLDAAASLA